MSPARAACSSLCMTSSSSMQASVSEPMGPPSFSTNPRCHAFSARQARGRGRPGKIMSTPFSRKLPSAGPASSK
eukprot:5470127-Alexandrium_andersonii.AAC.1